MEWKCEIGEKIFVITNCEELFTQVWKHFSVFSVKVCVSKSSQKNTCDLE
jgi:hypothetical protein